MRINEIHVANLRTNLAIHPILLENSQKIDGFVNANLGKNRNRFWYGYRV